MKYIINHSLNFKGHNVHTITNEDGKIIDTRTSKSKTFKFALIECYFHANDNNCFSQYIESNCKKLWVTYSTHKVSSAYSRNFAVAYASNL